MIVFLNGSLGVGKTSVSQYLLWCEPKTVLLEGDALCNLNPFEAYDKDRIRTLMEILKFMVAQYRKMGYTRFVIDNVFEKQEEIAAVNDLLRDEDGEIFHYLLHCDDGPRNARIEARHRENYLWEKERSAELQGLLLDEFRSSGLMRLVDTSAKTIQEVGDGIRNDRRAQGQRISVGNLELYYEDFGAGPPLVLLHGFGGSTKNWSPFTTELSKHHRLIVVDLRGHGHSTNPENRFTHREAAGDVFTLLEKLGIERFSAMGMSTGGMTLLHMAVGQPWRFESLVLISATTHFPAQAKIIMRRASWVTLPQEVRAMYQECAPRGEGQIRELLGQFNALADNDDDMDFTAERLSAITAPTLIVHGDRDNFFPPAIPRNMHRWIAGSSLWIIPHGDHVPVYDSSVPFTAEALKFLAGGRVPGLVL